MGQAPTGPRDATSARRGPPAKRRSSSVVVVGGDDRNFQHLRRKAGSLRDVVHRVTLTYQVASLFKGPAAARVEPRHHDLTRISAFLRPAETCTACQGSTSESLIGGP